MRNSACNLVALLEWEAGGAKEYFDHGDISVVETCFISEVD